MIEHELEDQSEFDADTKDAVHVSSISQVHDQYCLVSPNGE